MSLFFPKESPKTPIPTGQDIATNLEVLKFGMQVHSRVRKVMTEDYILASLDEKQKEFVLETSTSAFMAKRYMTLLMYDEQEKNWKWHPETNSWKKEELPEFKQKYFEVIGDGSFDQFMGRPTTMTLVERNKKDNFFAKGIFGLSQEEEQPEYEEVSGLKKLKEQFKALGKKTNEEGE